MLSQDRMLDQDHAYITSNTKDYLWFLSRTRTVKPASLALFKSKAQALGFYLSSLYIIQQDLRNFHFLVVVRLYPDP